MLTSCPPSRRVAARFSSHCDSTAFWRAATAARCTTWQPRPQIKAQQQTVHLAAAAWPSCSCCEDELCKRVGGACLPGGSAGGCRGGRRHWPVLFNAPILPIWGQPIRDRVSLQSTRTTQCQVHYHMPGRIWALVECLDGSMVSMYDEAGARRAKLHAPLARASMQQAVRDCVLARRMHARTHTALCSCGELNGRPPMA